MISLCYNSRQINFYDPSQDRDASGKWTGVVAYHGTTKEAKDAIEKNGYDVSKSPEGGMWLTTNKEAVTKKDVGASGHGDIVERIIDESSLKLGGWKEYDKYLTDQLIGWGFDGLKLPDEDGIVYKIFFPEKLAKVIGKSPLNKFQTNFYDPSQDRDSSGKWSGSSGNSTSEISSNASTDSSKAIAKAIKSEIKGGSKDVEARKQVESEISEISKTFSDANVTPEESVQHLVNINKYTSESINMAIALREPKIEKTSWGDYEDQLRHRANNLKQADDLEKTLKVMPKTKSDVIYRGVFDKEGDYDSDYKIDALAGRTNVGAIFKELSFTSSTKSERVAQNSFAEIKPDFFTRKRSKDDFNEGNGSKVLLKITGVKGRGVDVPRFLNGGYEDEQEVILPKGSRFKVMNVQRVLIYQPTKKSPPYMRRKKYITKLEVKLL